MLLCNKLSIIIIALISRNIEWTAEKKYQFWVLAFAFQIYQFMPFWNKKKFINNTASTTIKKLNSAYLITYMRILKAKYIWVSLRFRIFYDFFSAHIHCVCSILNYKNTIIRQYSAVWNFSSSLFWMINKFFADFWMGNSTKERNCNNYNMEFITSSRWNKVLPWRSPHRPLSVQWALVVFS